MKEKIVIYQVLPRLFGNRNTTRKENGTIEENGCGKLNNFSDEVLARIHDMGFTHIWFTGVIRHATQTNYSSYGIPTQHAEVVKGKAGSPYAITDYYDIDPDLAVNVSLRMKEWAITQVRTAIATTPSPQEPSTISTRASESSRVSGMDVVLPPGNSVRAKAAVICSTMDSPTRE